MGSDGTYPVTFFAFRTHVTFLSRNSLKNRKMGLVDKQSCQNEFGLPLMLHSGIYSVGEQPNNIFQ